MQLDVVLGLSVFMLVGCEGSAISSVASEEHEGTSQLAIRAGIPATQYPEAVVLNMGRGQAGSLCSAAVIAPKTVLTAGHCVYGYGRWSVYAPYASGQRAEGTGAAVYDWRTNSAVADPTLHDIGLVFLDRAISLSTYPTLAREAMPDGSRVVNVGRVLDDNPSDDELYTSSPITITSAASIGFPYNYVALPIIESGDSGGPDFLADTHTIVAVNSAVGMDDEILARVDLVSAWIAAQIASPEPNVEIEDSGASDGGSARPPAACVHDVCTQGVQLEADCDACVAKICAHDPFCCFNQWDVTCKAAVPSSCGFTCENASKN